MSIFNNIREYLEKNPSFQCIPVKDKAPFIGSWQDVEVNDEVIDAWEESFLGVANGFGVRAGQNNVGWMDIDTDDAQIIFKIDEVMDLSNVCVKRGVKGKTVFFRYESEPKKGKYNVYLRKGDKKPIVEFNFTTGQTVLPPSAHPSGVTYKWISDSLLDIDIEDLPVIDESKIEFLEEILRAPSLEEGLKNVPTFQTGDGSGKFITITREASRLLHLGHSESSIARTLVGLDRRLFPGNQFFLSKKIGKCLVGKDDYENATFWVTDYKCNLMKQDTDLRRVMMNTTIVSEEIPSMTEWFEPRPLLTKKQMVHFPEHLMPPIFKDYCGKLSDLSALPPETYFMGLMTAFSACSQGRIILDIKHDLSLRPSINSLLVAPSGSRKDAVFDSSVAPLKKLIKRDKDIYATNSIDDENILTQTLIDLDKKMKKAISEGDKILIEQLKKERNFMQGELNEMKKKKSNFIFESGTQERLYKLMEENQDRGIFVCSSEFITMLGVMSKKGNEAMRSFLIKLFNGSVSESFSHQTIGGVNVDISKVFGVSLAGIQTDVLAGIFRGVEQGNNNDGFIQRFFLIPIDGKIERMVVDDTPIDSSKVDNLFQLIYDLPSEQHVSFENKKALDAYIEYDYMLRERAKNDVSFIRSFRSKYSGQSLKCAWLLGQMFSKPGEVYRKIKLEDYIKSTQLMDWASNTLDATYGNINYNEIIRHTDLVIDSVRNRGRQCDISNIKTDTKMDVTQIKDALSVLQDNFYLKVSGTKVTLNPKA